MTKTLDLMDNFKAWACEVMNPLRREFKHHGRRLTLGQFKALREAGIPATHMLGEIGAAQIDLDHAGEYWQPGETGPEHVIVPLEEAGVMLDMIAFRLTKPGEWFHRTGNGWALGFDAIGNARREWVDERKAIWLHRTPLDWLKADRRGACVLDWNEEAIIELREANLILVDTPEFANAVHEQLLRPPKGLPPISIKRGRRGP